LPSYASDPAGEANSARPNVLVGFRGKERKWKREVNKKVGARKERARRRGAEKKDMKG